MTCPPGTSPTTPTRPCSSAVSWLDGGGRVDADRAGPPAARLAGPDARRRARRACSARPRCGPCSRSTPTGRRRPRAGGATPTAPRCASPRSASRRRPQPAAGARRPRRRGERADAQHPRGPGRGRRRGGRRRRSPSTAVTWPPCSTARPRPRARSAATRGFYTAAPSLAGRLEWAVAPHPRGGPRVRRRRGARPSRRARGSSTSSSAPPSPPRSRCRPRSPSLVLADAARPGGAADPWLVCRIGASLGGDCDTIAAMAGRWRAPGRRQGLPGRRGADRGARPTRASASTSSPTTCSRCGAGGCRRRAAAASPPGRSSSTCRCSVPAPAARGGDVLAATAGLAPAVGSTSSSPRPGRAPGWPSPARSAPARAATSSAPPCARRASRCSPPRPRGTPALVVALVEPDGERTFVTTIGAEGRPRVDELAAAWRCAPGDLVYVSGYDLVYPDAAPVVGPWAAAPAGRRAARPRPQPAGEPDRRPRCSTPCWRAATCSPLNAREATVLAGSEPRAGRRPGRCCAGVSRRRLRACSCGSASPGAGCGEPERRRAGARAHPPHAPGGHHRAPATSTPACSPPSCSPARRCAPRCAARTSRPRSRSPGPAAAAPPRPARSWTRSRHRRDARHPRRGAGAATVRGR